MIIPISPIVVIFFIITFFFASYFTVKGIRILTKHRYIIDYPNERSLHEKPIPKGGGISIVFLTLIGFWMLYIIDSSFHRVDWLIYFSLGALLIAAISFIDDIYSVRNTIRFVIHCFAAIIIVWGIGYVDELSVPFGKDVYFGIVGIILTILFIAGLTNAYNFMDGIDGIASLQGILAGIGWGVIGYVYTEPFILLLGLLVASVTAGFFVHNWHPAKIFMGDVGSAFLGFVFASVTIMAFKLDPLLFYVGILFVWPFIFDTIYTLFRRLIRGENIFIAHRSHLYQRLVIAGWNHTSVTLLYGFLSIMAWIPIGLMILDVYLWFIIMFIFPVMFFLMLVYGVSKYEKGAA